MSFYDKIEKFKSNCAVLLENGTSYSYDTLVKDSDKLAKLIGNRTLILSICTNTYESLIGYVGSLRNNIVPVMIDENLNDELLLSLIKTYEPSHIWLPSKKEININLTEVYDFQNYKLCKTTYNSDIKLNKELGLLLTTSGSTGSPKLVRQSYNNLESNTQSIIEYLGISSSDRAITTLPMHYTYGLSIINSHLEKGATLLLTGRTIVEKEFWKFFNDEKATTFGGVPFTYQMLKRLRFFNMNLINVKYITQAGGKIPYDLQMEFATECGKRNIGFIVMYGQTEATARMSYLPRKYAIEKCGAMGIAIPGGKFSLIDVDGNEINKPEVVGELVYVGDNVTLGYAESKLDLAKGDERYKRLVTGDMAKFDKDGFYYIVGRKKRFVKIFGSRVNLDETERLLQSKGYACACCGVDDKMNIFTEDKGKEENLKKEVISLLKLNPIAFQVKYIEEIPKNAAGKTLYKAMENL